jgi:hypothetical protein
LIEKRDIMNTLYDLIKGNSGLIVGIIGIMIGFLSFLKSRRQRKLAYLVKTTRITEKQEKIPKFKIMYENKNIEAFSLSRVALFNDGNEVIDSSIMSKKDPLRIIISESFQILDMNLFYIKNEANDFSLIRNEKGNVAEIDFDYMNEGDGCIVEVFHDGAASDDISVAGSFKGIKGINQKQIEGMSREETHFYWVLTLALLVSLLAFRILHLSSTLTLVLPFISLFIYRFVYYRYLKKFLISNVEFFESKM